MAKKTLTTMSVEDKLKALYDLQIVDRRIDEIRNLRGELPLEVKDLEDEIAGLSNRVEKITEDIKVSKQEIKGHKLLITTCEEKMTKYTDQQKNVRNNREFDAIAKEVEYQELEIELAKKHISEFEENVTAKSLILEAAEEKMTERKSHLEFKQGELEGIIKETEKEEKDLMEKTDALGLAIGDERLLKRYNQIRNKVLNRLAVVSIARDASTGSFFTIPPQRQLEIALRKKIMFDEHSGRILVDAELAQEREEAMASSIA
ncbi:MAG: hypothetical protein HOE88_01140 [Flavobacteriales bacterium]|jgi:hypothetical protein|nr:hypothetical protein [Flavobacteriales bacterium]MBT3571875.1 hypothetical protein [Flavobacteriales bacterium]MBT3678466.1 hypothetical protein [Flavobacteriales bacterium]MBT3740031.1 hypothetical protein [Flavobacteriales bacterium]MBT4101977.1 hypothetical protein [Flavobacteriales bacterium]